MMSTTALLKNRYDTAVADGNLAEAHHFGLWLGIHEPEVELPVATENPHAAIQHIIYHLSNLHVQQATSHIAEFRKKLPRFEVSIMESFESLAVNIQAQLDKLERAESREDFDTFSRLYKRLLEINLSNAELHRRYGRCEAHQLLRLIETIHEEAGDEEETLASFERLKKHAAHLDEDQLRRINDLRTQFRQKDSTVQDVQSDVMKLLKQGNPLRAIEKLDEAIAAVGPVDTLVEQRNVIEAFADDFESRIQTVAEELAEGRPDSAARTLQEAEELLPETDIVKRFREKIQRQKRSNYDYQSVSAQVPGDFNNERKEKTGPKEIIQKIGFYFLVLYLVVFFFFFLSALFS